MARFDIGEVFRNAWTARCERECGMLGNQTIPGIEIRRFVAALEGANMWKHLDEEATEGQLFLLGLDIARLMRREDGTCEPFALWMGRYAKEEIVELGRIAYKAVRGPKHRVVQALLRRFK